MSKSSKVIKARGNKKYTPTAAHTVAFQAVGLATDEVDIFGKVVSPAPILGLPGGHQIALVFGYREQDCCVPLPVPLQLSLPHPTGVADGCGWDPASFVVWKGISKSLLTTQIQTPLTPIHEALYRTSNLPEPTVDDILHQWLKQSIPGQFIPPADQLQVAWKDFGTGGAYSLQEQQNLANLLNSAFSPQPRVVAANLPAILTVAKLKQMLHRSV